MLCHCLGWESSVYVSASGCGGEVQLTHTHTHMQMFDWMSWKRVMFGPDSFSLSLIVGKWVSDVTARLITLGPARPHHVLPNHIKEPWADVGR